jgi:hypothetical protein
MAGVTSDTGKALVKVATVQIYLLASCVYFVSTLITLKHSNSKSFLPFFIYKSVNFLCPYCIAVTGFFQLPFPSNLESSTLRSDLYSSPIKPSLKRKQRSAYFSFSASFCLVEAYFCVFACSFNRLLKIIHRIQGNHPTD